VPPCPAKVVAFGEAIVARNAIRRTWYFHQSLPSRGGRPPSLPARRPFAHVIVAVHNRCAFVGGLRITLRSSRPAPGCALRGRLNYDVRPQKPAPDPLVSTKQIRGAAHNWTHSFMSDMNYVDGVFVHEEVRALARAKRPEKVVITWLPTPVAEASGLPSRTLKCIQSYRKGLEEFLARNGVEKHSIAELATEVYVEETFRLYVRAVAKGTNGKDYSIFVWP